MRLFSGAKSKGPGPGGQPGAAKTASWFDDAALEAAAQRYTGFRVAPVSYGTVRDFCDSFDHLRPLATANGDLKDCQRPWVLKAVLGTVKRGGRLLEIGGGEPWVADLLSRLGYEVWIVDPYDGTGHGPLEFERYRAECPKVRFVRSFFDDRADLPAQSFDCVYSISVIEHIPGDQLPGVFAGMRKVLRPGGVSLHAIDSVLRGADAEAYQSGMRYIAGSIGLSVEDVSRAYEAMKTDPETYFLSAESHNRWRNGVPYDQFPMRVMVSVQLATGVGSR